jgi:hypothetical protein
MDKKNEKNWIFDCFVVCDILSISKLVIQIKENLVYKGIHYLQYTGCPQKPRKLLKCIVRIWMPQHSAEPTHASKLDVSKFYA